MASSSSKLSLYVDSSVHSVAALVVAACCDFHVGELEVLVESSKEFTDVQPPRVPFLQTDDSGPIAEPKTIVRYLARRKPLAGLLGDSLEDSTLVEEWLSVYALHLSTPKPPPSHVLRRLNGHLASCVFFVGTRLSAADCVLYAALHATVAGLSAAARDELVHIVRWLDHVQYLPQMAPLHNIAPSPPLPLLLELVGRTASPLYAINLAALAGADASAAAAKIVRPPKVKGDAAPVGAVGTGAPVPAAGGAPAPAPPATETKELKAAAPTAEAGKAEAKKEGRGKKEDGKGPKEEKKEKSGGDAKKKEEKKGGAGAAAAAAAAPAAAGKKPQSNRLDVRVGQVVSAVAHPTDPAKYIETIDVGEAKPRTVVSGVAAFIPLSEFSVGRRLAVCINLGSITLAGVESHGLVFVATSSDGKTKELVTPPLDALIGERITFPGGPPGPPDAAIAQKNFHEIKKALRTNDLRQAAYGDMPFTTSAGPCTVKSITGGSVA